MTDTIYQPEPKRRGRPPSNPDATKTAVETAVDVSDGVTASAELAPDATPKADETLEQAIARIRAVRAPFGAMSQKLALPERPGYHRHWFNDVAGRIDEAKSSGWAHVTSSKDGTPLKRIVGTGRDNSPLAAYAMELPLVFWQEEMDARHSVATAKMDSIKKNPFASKPGQSQASDKGKFYDPNEGTGTGPLSIVKG